MLIILAELQFLHIAPFTQQEELLSLESQVKDRVYLYFMLPACSADVNKEHRICHFFVVGKNMTHKSADKKGQIWTYGKTS